MIQYDLTSYTFFMDGLTFNLHLHFYKWFNIDINSVFSLERREGKNKKQKMLPVSNLPIVFVHVECIKIGIF